MYVSGLPSLSTQGPLARPFAVSVIPKITGPVPYLALCGVMFKTLKAAKRSFVSLSFLGRGNLALSALQADLAFPKRLVPKFAKQYLLPPILTYLAFLSVHVLTGIILGVDVVGLGLPDNCPCGKHMRASTSSESSRNIIKR